MKGGPLSAASDATCWDTAAQELFMPGVYGGSFGVLPCWELCFSQMFSGPSLPPGPDTLSPGPVWLPRALSKSEVALNLAAFL